MNAPNLFLRAVESTRALEHEARLTTRDLDALPDSEQESNSTGLRLRPPARSSRNSKSIRLAAIRACRDEGIEPPELAVRFGLSERQVYRLLRRSEPRRFTNTDQMEAP